MPLKWLTVSLLLIALMGAVQITTVLDETATWDEPVHIAAGYSYWVTGQYDFNPEHPALVKMLCALPLYLVYRPEFHPNPDPVMAGNLFLYRNTVSPDKLLFSARLVNICLTLLFAAYLAWWTRRRLGPAVSLFALTLFVFDSNIIAHGRYVTTDLAAAFFIFTTCALWIEYLLQPRWYWLVLTGASLGLALTSKYSTLYLPPVLILIAVVYVFPWRTHSCVPCRHSWRHLGLRRNQGVGKSADTARTSACATVALPMIAIAIMALVYWPEVRRTSNLPALGPSLSRKGPVAPILSTLAALPGYTYLVGIDRLSEHDGAGHPSYLLGQVSDHGWWYYFPVAFAVKTPAATLFALLLALALVWRSKHRRLLASLAIPAIAYFALALGSHINLGIRHLLPIYPFLYVVIACVVMEQKWWKPAVLAISLFVAIESLAAYPNYLPFFNTLAGGPNAGPKYLLDSNLDWGQDYRKLGRYLHQQGIPKVCLGFFANVDFPHYGVNPIPIPTGANADNLDCVVAISATPLFGQYVGLERFAWLRARQPTAIIGHSIYVYDLRKNHS